MTSRKPYDILAGLRNARNGFFRTLETEANFRIEIMIALVAIPGAFFLPLTMLERCGVWFFAVAVLVAELFNTAVERFVDGHVPEHSPHARDAKDAAAAAVLLVVVAAALYGVAIAWRLGTRVW